MRRLVSILFIVLLCLASIQGKAHAVETKGVITISPFLQEVRFAPNAGITAFTMQVTNKTLKTQNFKLSAVDFGSLDESGGVVFAGSDASGLIKKYGLASWLALDKQTLILTPGQASAVHITIIDDVKLTPGGHYAAIVASIESGQSSDVNQINVNQKISSLILATKTGGEKYDLALSKIETENNLFTLPKSVVLSFHNPGNVHVVPRGTVKIISTGGRVVAQGIINEESGFILPETSRQILVNLSPIGDKGLWPSAYKVQVDYRYDGIEQFARKEKVLFIISPVGLATLLVILIAVGWVLVKLRLLQKLARNFHNFRFKKD